MMSPMLAESEHLAARSVAAAAVAASADIVELRRIQVCGF